MAPGRGRFGALPVVPPACTFASVTPVRFMGVLRGLLRAVGGLLLGLGGLLKGVFTGLGSLVRRLV